MDERQAEQQVPPVDGLGAPQPVEIATAAGESPIELGEERMENRAR